MEPGSPHPLGARVVAGGAGFSVFSRNARCVELLLYDGVDDVEPARVIALDPKVNRTYHYWHTFVPGVGAGQIYAYRAHGPLLGPLGAHFDGDKVLIDPYGRAVAEPSDYRRVAAAAPGRNDAHAFKSVVTDVDAYDWQGDAPLRRPFAQTIIYELHVGGFTKHPSSGVTPERRGTYAGLIEKIPYLVDLGVTAVELIPVFQFDSQDAPPGLTNYWGYAPVSLFAPHIAYSSRRDPLGAVDEFRDMVKALHRAGVEVILDVVYNHTAEGGEHGPTLSLRGLDCSTYYMLDAEGRFANYSGTGNTLNANQSIVRRLIIDSLHYWVEVMHVDGFRFDLASILSRGEDGEPLPTPPVLWDIESDPVLAGTKLIAEAWDAAGLYQVGTFVGDSWKEWNGQFRDDVRAFLRGDPGMVPRLADRLLGSPDLYGDAPREPEQSINFVTCHDGFTLADVVSYDRKHNEANRDDSRDGSDHNLSWNCGVEGPTDDLEVEALRLRQIKNFLAVNLLSLGAPMLTMGDEVRRTQRGNNNAYCQDNDISWFDWTNVTRHADIHRFVKTLIRIRAIRESVSNEHNLTLAELVHRADVRLHGVHLDHPDLTHPSRSLSLTAQSLSGDLLMHFAISAYCEPLQFELPSLPAWATSGWLRIMDTSLPSPLDIVEPVSAVRVSSPTYPVSARTAVMLFALATA